METGGGCLSGAQFAVASAMTNRSKQAYILVS